MLVSSIGIYICSTMRYLHFQSDNLPRTIFSTQSPKTIFPKQSSQNNLPKTIFPNNIPCATLDLLVIANKSSLKFCFTTCHDAFLHCPLHYSLGYKCKCIFQPLFFCANNTRLLLLLLPIVQEMFKTSLLVRPFQKHPVIPSLVIVLLLNDDNQLSRTGRQAQGLEPRPIKGTTIS